MPEAGSSPHRINAIAVFCGSNTGLGRRYMEAAKALGDETGRRGMRLVYSGTNKGLMGAVKEKTACARSVCR